MADTGQHQQSHERYMGGSPEAERRIFERLTKELIKVQEKNRRAARAADIGRVQHEKAALGVENARLRFHDDLPDTLRCGFAQPGAQYPATVRLSNAGGIRQADGA
ncbi:peroxidase, partial [Streptomyces sp. SID10116]|nr:peroxidase [Streptomyces sp. SID10116]